MPRAICDSEDEDEILLDDDPSQRSTYSAHIAQAEAILAADVGGFDGANDQQPASTTSSELRGEIQNAQQNLCATASASTPAIATSMSPSKSTRRRTTVVGSEPIGSPQKSVRRTKTSNLKTYGNSNRTFQAPGSAAFAALQDDAAAPKTSQSARFTEHSSGPNASSGLPGGTIQADFINHEPNVMFKDTASTNAFNESSQQRLVEQALNNGEDGNVTHEERAETSTEKHQSSSFPWSASADPTQSPRKQPLDEQTQHMQPLDAPEDTITVATKQTPVNPSTDATLADTNPTDKHTAAANVEGTDKTSAEIAKASSKSRPPKSSPIVEIPRYQPSPEDEAFEPPKASRGRKRKAQDDAAEPLNSDDRAIGLPKENYKPRPSRRRATAVLEEPADYSAIPGKTSKKRRKTAEGNIGSANQQQSEKESTTTQRSTSTASKVNVEEQPVEQSNGDPKEPEPERIDSVPTPQKGSQQSGSSSKEGPASTKKAADAMLMKPPSLPASATRKSRRSVTTIFEDHVELNRSQRSPSLSQQQANRKAALVELPNGSKTSNRKKRRTIVDEDDDDEDELAKDMSNEEDAAPKKRGRPAKPKPQTKSKEKVLEDSEAEDDELELEEDEDEPPKRKGRGRPAKKKADAVTKQKKVEQSAEGTSSDAPIELTSELPGQSSPSKAALERKYANAKLPSKDTPIPSIEKPAQQASKTTESPSKTPAKPSPTTTHSPIKGSTFANYRVGLSKRSRIPSLLKSFRAPAPARR